MAIDIIRDAIDVERKVGENTTQALVEGSVLMSGAGREPVHILYSDARMGMDSAEVQSERVAMDGQVLFCVLYTTGSDQRVKQMEAAITFNHAVDIPGAGPRMNARVTGEIEHVEAEASGGRLMLRAVVRLNVGVTFPTQVMAITEISGVEALQTQHETIRSVAVSGAADKRVSLKEEFELAFGMEPLEVLMGKERVRIDRVAAGDGVVTVSGEVVSDVLYALDSDRPLYKTRNTIPFEEELSVPAAQIGDRARVTGSVSDADYGLERDGDKTYMSMGVTLALHAETEETHELEVIADAYSASATQIVLKTDEIDISGGTEEFDSTDSVKTSVALPAGLPPVAGVLTTFVRPVVSARSGDTRAQVEGVLDLTVIYMPVGEMQPTAFSEEVPFHAAFDFMLPEGARSTLIVEDAEAIQITSDRLELKCQLRMQGAVQLGERATVALDVEAQEEGEPLRGGITLYFAQPGEDEWAVAKRFRITQEDIERQNPGVKEIGPGTCLLLYRRKLPA